MTYFIILLTVVVSYAGFSQPAFNAKCLFVPYLVKKNGEYYRFITGGFLHANWPHLLLNMIVLFFFGSVVEDYFNYYFPYGGILLFTIMYLGAIIVSDIYSYNKNKNNSYYASLGASGAVSAIVFSYILFDPLGTIYVFMFLPVPAVIFGVAYLFYSMRMAKQSGDHINHDAHLFGSIFGIIFPLLLKPSIGIDFIEHVSIGIQKFI